VSADSLLAGKRDVFSRWIVGCRYLTKYSCKDVEEYCAQNTTAFFLHEACKQQEL